MSKFPEARPQLENLLPYQPGTSIEALAQQYHLRPDQIIKLASNENPYGMSLKVSKALQAAALQSHRYPDVENVRQALADHYALKPENIVLGNGSNDVLSLIAQTFLGPSTTAVSSEYAFAVYRLITTAVGAKNTVVSATDYAHDLAAMRQAITKSTKVVWIANPNNPTGSFAEYAEVKAFLEMVPTGVLIVLDEAYYEYLPDDLRADTTKWLAEHPNLVIVRTFSKAYGLAGLRVGYGLAAPKITELLNRIRQPFNVSVLAAAGALAALEDQEYVVQSRTRNQRARADLLAELKKLGLSCLPAYGNFVTIQVLQATAVAQSLLQKGIIVRPLAADAMPDYLRVTVGTPTENDLFLQNLKEVIK